MKKIPNVFKRNPENMHEILEEINPLCQWVADGDGMATRKYDGTCVLIEEGVFYKRREVKAGKEPPYGFVEVEHDTNTGKTVGWIAVDPNDPSDKWHMEAFSDKFPDGTFELCGPKVQGNPEGLNGHVLVRHETCMQFPTAPRDYHRLKAFLASVNIEGLVFHHPDGRMAKIRKSDFNQKRH